VVLAVGGPAFTYWLTPTEEELFKKYNPELQKKSLENRQQKQEEFDQFVTKLKEYSKSDRPSRLTPLSFGCVVEAKIYTVWQCSMQKGVAQDVGNL
jgi:hypothetical protein